MKKRKRNAKKMLELISRGIRFNMSRQLKEQEKSQNPDLQKEVLVEKGIIVVKIIPDYTYTYDGVTGWSKRPNGNHLVP